MQRNLGIAFTFALLFGPLPVAAATWPETFAADSTVVAFYTTDARILRAPFRLQRDASLWATDTDVARASPRHASLVFLSNADASTGPARFKASPAGRHVAWIERDKGSEISQLWIAENDDAELGAIFIGPRADQFDVVRYEPETPTTHDAGPVGPRFITPYPSMLGSNMTTLEWTRDGRSVAFGTNVGLGLVSMADDTARIVFPHPVAALEPLRPSRLFRARVFEQRDGRWVSETRFLSPAPGAWQARQVPGFDFDDLWTASRQHVWWAEGKRLRVLRVDEMAPLADLVSEDRIVWLDFDATRHTLLWAAGRQLFERRTPDGDARTMLHTRTPIASVHRLDRARGYAIVSADSLIVWSPERGRSLAVRLSGFQPDDVFAGPASTLVASQGGREKGRIKLARLDRNAGKLVRVANPKMSKGMLFRSPGGRALLLVKVGSKIAQNLQVYDFLRAEWDEVPNPGIAGWEPFAEPNAP